jgi:hypothetical protein
VAMLLGIPMALVMIPSSISLHYNRKARSWFISPAMTHLLLCLLKHLHPFKKSWQSLIRLNLFSMVLEKNGLPSRILVSCIIIIHTHILTLVVGIEYTIFVYDIIWTLLGSFEEITSVDGDEEITWHTENNKPVLQILLVIIFILLADWSFNNSTEQLRFTECLIYYCCCLCC